MKELTMFWIILCSVVGGVWVIGIALMIAGRTSYNRLTTEEKEKIRAKVAEARLTPQQKIARVQAGLVEYVSNLDDFDIGNSVVTNGGMGILAVDSAASQIVFAFDFGENRRGHTIFTAKDILSVEADADIKSEQMTIGAFGGIDGMPILGMKGFNWTHVKAAYLVVMVNDIKNPWAVVSMPDLASAEQWRGIISVVIHKAAA